MVCVMSNVAVIDDNVVDNAAVPGQPCECFVHPAIVVFRDRRDPIGGTEILEPAEWGDECCE